MLIQHSLETLDPAINVSDIDETSTKIDELFAADDTGNFQRLQRIAPAYILHNVESRDSSATALYDTMLQECIAPLPAEVPIAVRQAKERLARRIAAEVTLASSRLRLKDEVPPSQLEAVAGDALPLPILSSKPMEVLPLSLPTPPQSSVPPSSPLVAEYLQPPVSDPLSRLRRHLTINDESPMTPTIIPSSVSNLLSHWQPGIDPSTYDW